LTQTPKQNNAFKMQYSTLLLAALGFGSAAQAHMALSYPAPFRAKNNPYADPSTIDYSMTSSLNADGSNFPCKGYQTDMGTPAGKPTADWTAGSSYNFSLAGGATHEGGSCQASLSYDKGKTFKVIHSYEGNCPSSTTESFPFTVPADAPTGDAIFAWEWYNKVGNREIYMNCAAVTINGGSGSTSKASNASSTSTPFAQRPDIFVANIGKGCTTVEGKEVQFPQPGPDVTNNLSGDNSGSFTGSSCS
jgi:hypothetical protein